MRPFEQAWRLLKMPVVDTNVPGVQMAYGTDVEEPVIGNIPYMWGGDDQITQMTPNEYFDAINQNTENIRGLPRVPSRDAPYRWDNRQFNEHGDSRANIARIIEGIKSGMPIGMPELEFRNDKYSGLQEGGHRMEALRQMGHADTPVPVFRHNRLLKGEYEDIPKEEHRNYYAGSLNALPGHKPGCDLRLNGYYPHYSASKYSGKCTCEAQCANCGAKEKWGYPYNDTDLCFDCTEKLAGQGVIDDPLINWMHSQPGGMPLPKTDDEDWQSNIETGEPMDLAFRLLKAPVYTDDNPPPMQQSRHYEMLPYLDQMGGYMWQSEDGMARGTMRPDYFLNSLLINNFEMAGPVRGQNKSRQYIQDMIDQGHAHFDHELDGTHVTNVERHSAGYWNKLVNEGVLDGAHERPNIRTNLDGDQHFVYAYDKESKQPWSHELSEDYADYHDLPTDAVYDNI